MRMDLINNAVVDINKKFEDMGFAYRLSFHSSLSDWYKAETVDFKFKTANGSEIGTDEWKSLRNGLNELGLQSLYVNDRGVSAFDGGQTLAFIYDKLAGKPVEKSSVYAIPEFLNHYLAENNSDYRLTVLRNYDGEVTYQFVRTDGKAISIEQDRDSLSGDLQKMNLSAFPVTLGSGEKNWFTLFRPVIKETYLSAAEVYIKDKVFGIDRKQGNTIFHLRDLINEQAEENVYFFDRRGKHWFLHGRFDEKSLKELGFSAREGDSYLAPSRIDAVCEAIKNKELKHSEAYYAWKFKSILPVKNVDYDYLNDEYYCFTMRTTESLAKQVVKPLQKCGVKVEKIISTKLNCRYSLYLSHDNADRVLAEMGKIDWDKEISNKPLQVQNRIAEILSDKEHE